MLVREAHSDAPLGVRELAKALPLVKPSVTRGCKRLAAAGLLAVRPHPTDKRLIVLSLTAAGKRAADRMLAA